MTQPAHVVLSASREGTTLKVGDVDLSDNIAAVFLDSRPGMTPRVGVELADATLDYEGPGLVTIEKPGADPVELILAFLGAVDTEALDAKSLEGGLAEGPTESIIRCLRELVAPPVMADAQGT